VRYNKIGFVAWHQATRKRGFFTGKMTEVLIIHKLITQLVKIYKAVWVVILAA